MLTSYIQPSRLAGISSPDTAADRFPQHHAVPRRVILPTDVGEIQKVEGFRLPCPSPPPPFRRATLLPSGPPDPAGASDFGYFGAHQPQGYPAYMCPCPTLPVRRYRRPRMVEARMVRYSFSCRAATLGSAGELRSPKPAESRLRAKLPAPQLILKRWAST